MEMLLKDIRYAVSMMRRSKSFPAAGLLTPALGIGANTGVFSVSCLLPASRAAQTDPIEALRNE